MDAIETIEINDKVIKIYYDDEPMNPRTEWDNLGTMVCWHRGYALGDKGVNHLGWMEGQGRKPYLWLPLYLYDHSGITMRTTPFGDPWDSGQVGIIYIERETIVSEYGWRRISSKRLEQIKTYLRSEVETYDQYLTGEVYGYQVVDADGEVKDSCWGFFGEEGKKQAIEEAKFNLGVN